MWSSPALLDSPTPLERDRLGIMNRGRGESDERWDTTKPTRTTQEIKTHISIALVSSDGLRQQGAEFCMGDRGDGHKENQLPHGSRRSTDGVLAQCSLETGSASRANRIT